MSVPGQRILPRSLPHRALAPAGGKWRGYSQKRDCHAMVSRRAGQAPRPPPGRRLKARRCLIAQARAEICLLIAFEADAREAERRGGQKFFHL
jgi:hypothetical protein